MQNSLIVNWNDKKFSVFIIFSIIIQIICCLIGAFVDPQTFTRENILATACKYANESEKWYYTKGKGGCDVMDMFSYGNSIEDKVYHAVYTSRISSPMDDNNLDNYSKRQQNVKGILHIDINREIKLKLASRYQLLLDVKLAYRNKDDPDDNWKFYASSLLEKTLKCSTCDLNEYHDDDCSPITLFQLNSDYHDYYLLNIRFPIIDEKNDINYVVRFMADLWLTAIHQNENSTNIWIGFQTFFFPIVNIIIIWYWSRIRMLTESPTLLHYIVLILGCALSILNSPIEYLTDYIDVQIIVHLNDIKHGMFYAVLFSFCFIFVGEHLMIQHSNSLKYYFGHLSAVFIGCLSLCICNKWERIIRLSNPFVMITDNENLNSEVSFSFVTYTKILAVIYLLILSHMIWKVYFNININKILLPSIDPDRCLHYKHVTYRIKFLIISTLGCAILTIIGFVHREMMEAQWKWNQDDVLNTTSALMTGMYGMWNVYTIMLLFLYAPLQKEMIN